MDVKNMVAIVESDYPGQTQANAREDIQSNCQGLLDFLKHGEHEVDQGGLPTSLLPIQCGIGNNSQTQLSGA